MGASKSRRSGRSTWNARGAARRAGGEERVAAEVEEVVVDADPRSAGSPRTSQNCAARNPSSGVRGATRSAERAATPPAPAGPGGRPCRWRSAAGRRGGRRPPAPCTRAAARRGARRRRRRSSRASADHVGHQSPLARSTGGAGLAGQDHRLAHAGLARARAASISPSSMRKPRIFTWWSMRPRYSRSPSGRQRARSPER